jgi:hypothetical protein
VAGGWAGCAVTVNAGVALLGSLADGRLEVNKKWELESDQLLKENNFAGVYEISS